MFAKWIPEVLGEIEALAGLPEPPTTETVEAVRKVIVNWKPLSADRPRVETFDAGGETGILISWEYSRLHFAHDGRAVMG